eukprot:CAMPEP_0201282906 /NCGR_PEP_ID=MMETSP1317-20130820/7012_1 /ASSEMBLY_ACC=CAM_ASM_000770 /TAXON_ID=187299 /ORGANISM="Undescribed Undescribed, Strain Undescribed" /LENGTH=65 /DNA_ID=CAMNT_0047597213 /DNA_START=401 /DNA_END=598 /DNA_ORIENTATION=+
MSDNKETNQTFMMKLSLGKGLEWFKHIAFITSYQDQYAPFESARVEVNAKAIQDPVKGAVYVQMA